VAVINAAMARFYFGGSDPVGRLVHVDSTSYQVVGVVADVTDHDLRAPPARRLYFAMAQSAATAGVSFAVPPPATRARGRGRRAARAPRRRPVAPRVGDPPAPREPLHDRDGGVMDGARAPCAGHVATR
jgi:hypothetical protein